jgi:hypothetical protein
VILVLVVVLYIATLTEVTVAEHLVQAYNYILYSPGMDQSPLG